MTIGAVKVTAAAENDRNGSGSGTGAADPALAVQADILTLMASKDRSLRRPSSCRSAPARVITCVAAWLVAVAAGGRDWSGVEVAWRDDPRPAADFAAGVEEPRLSRRALRRAARRGIQLGDGIDGPATARPAPAAAAHGGPIPVETTLGSPFLPAPAERATVHRDIGYGDDARQRIDLHLPPGCAGSGLPLIVWIPGGDWSGGPRTACPIDWLVDHGYAVASVGYRPVGTAVFPAQLDDCRAAVATLVRDADTWGIDVDRVCVVGAGGGGQLAALVACAEPGPRAPELATPSAVAALCTVGAPTHLTTLGAAHDRGSSAASRLVGGPLPEVREAALAASPLLHASADDPPALVIHGAKDDAVPVDQAVRFVETLRAAGVDAEAVILEASGAPDLGAASPAGGALLGFLDRALGPGARAAADNRTPALPTAAPPGTGAARP